MKRIFTVFLALTMFFSLCSFGSFADSATKNTLVKITKEQYLRILETRLGLSKSDAEKHYIAEFEKATQNYITAEKSKNPNFIFRSKNLAADPILTPMTIKAVDNIGAGFSVEFGVLGFCARPGGSTGYIASIDKSTIYSLESGSIGNYSYKKGYIDATNNKSYVHFKARGQFEVALQTSVGGGVSAELAGVGFQASSSIGGNVYFRKNVDSDLIAYVR